MPMFSTLCPLECMTSIASAAAAQRSRWIILRRCVISEYLMSLLKMCSPVDEY